MGIGIGLLTEYATGVDFPSQLKLLLSYLGIAMCMSEPGHV